MRWRVTGPELGAPPARQRRDLGPGRQPEVPADPPTPPELDPIEVVEFYAVAPTVSPLRQFARSPRAGRRSTSTRPRRWHPKLALADDRGLAGAGFWAIGYERGLPDYADLIARFAAASSSNVSVAGLGAGFVSAV